MAIPLKKAGLTNVQRSDLISTAAGEDVKVFEADVSASTDPVARLDALSDGLGNNLAFAYPDLAHDLQTRSAIPAQLLA